MRTLYKKNVVIRLLVKHVMRIVFSFTLTILLYLPSVFGQVNLELTGRLTYGNELNDIWAYVDEQGREYALVGTTEGLSIVSLENPENPSQLFFIEGVSSLWRDIKTFEGFAYVSNESANGIQIVDLRNLPNSINAKDTIIQNVRTVHNLYQDEGFLYAVGTNRDQFNGGMMVLDLNENPWIPKFAGAYADRYVHDVYVRNGRAYSAEIFEGFLNVLDISDKSQISSLGLRDYPNSFTHNTWLNDAGDVCFTTDELNAAYVHAFDVSDPSNIRMLDRIRSSVSNGNAIPHNVHVLNDFLVISYYKDGILLVDAARPDNLIEVGYYDTHPESGGGFDGSWGAYPFLPSGLILASDMSQGLFVLQPNYQRGCYFEGLIVDGFTSEPLTGALIKLLDTDQTQLSRGAGGFRLGVAESGIYTAVVSKFGYDPDTIEVELENGVLTERIIELSNSRTQSFSVKVISGEDGSPVPEAQLSIVTSNLQNEQSFTADGNGVTTTTQPEGRYTLIAGKLGFITQQIPLSLDGSQDEYEIVLPKGIYDDFALDFGWKVSGNAIAGIWERGIPLGTSLFEESLNPAFDAEGDVGFSAYVTGNQGLTFSDDDVDNGETILSSPEFDLSDMENPVLSFDRWFINVIAREDLGGANDSLRISVSNPSDSVTLAVIGDRLSNNWQQESFMLSEFIDTSLPLRVHFYAEDLDPGNFVEAGIDRFGILDNRSVNTTKSIPFEFELFPNPVKAHFQIQLKGQTKGEFLLGLYDLNGKKVFQQSFNEVTNTIEVNPLLPAGMYVAIIFKDRLPVASKKMILLD